MVTHTGSTWPRGARRTGAPEESTSTVIDQYVRGHASALTTSAYWARMRLIIAGGSACRGASLQRTHVFARVSALGFSDRSRSSTTSFAHLMSAESVGVLTSRGSSSHP